jgi:hypothetical protein
MLFFFGSSKKNVSIGEFQKVISTLYSRGFSQRERDEVLKIFRGDLYESGSEVGIDEKELERGLDFMRSNMRSHGLSSGKIDILEEVLRTKL